MYEDQTFEVIQARILGNVDDSFHKDEGSFIHTATAPTAAEHQQIYIEMDRMLEELFPDTATREYLIHHAALRGITPKEATQAIWKAQAMPTTVEIPIGTRFNCDAQNLQVIRNNGEGVYTLKCEDTGTAGNNISGKLTAINYVEGLTQIVLSELSEAGTDDESTDEFRKRFLIFLQKPATSGNKNAYYNWAMSVDGVGGAKVFSPPDEPDGTVVPDGNVWIDLIDENKKPAGELLINTVRTYIDSVRPIGAIVTVKAAEQLDINVKAKVTLTGSTDLAETQTAFKEALADYLEDNALELKRVSLAKVGDILFDIDGVDDYTEITLNGSAASVTIGDEQIARIGTVELEASTS